MDLNILNIYDHEGETERITLVVLKDTNLDQYVIIDNTYDSAGNIVNKERHAYWFPNQLVKTNEWVRLYTGKGTYSFTKEVRGGVLKNIHNFYWGLNSSVWNKNGDEAYVIHLSDFIKHAIKKA
jgi:hypothetical protein